MLMRPRKSASRFTAFVLICIGACGTSGDDDGGAGGGGRTASAGSSGTSGGAGGTTTGGAGGFTPGGAGGATGGSGGNKGGSGGGGVGGSGGTGGTANGGTGGTTSTGDFRGEDCNALAVQGDWIEATTIPSSPVFQAGQPAPGLYYLTSVAVVDGVSPMVERWTVNITPEPNSIMEVSIESKTLAPPVIKKVRFNATFTVEGNNLLIKRTCNPTSPYYFKHTATANMLTLRYSTFVYTLTRQP